MAQLLTDLTVREVSLVDKPANSETDPSTGRKLARARVALFKRDGAVDKFHPEQAREQGQWSDGGAGDKTKAANALTAAAKTPEQHAAAGVAHENAAVAHRRASVAAEVVGHTQAAKDHVQAAQGHDTAAMGHYQIATGIAKWDDADPICKAVDGQTVDGKVFPKSDWAFTPDDIPSHWKLRLTATPGGPPDAGIVGAAAAALGPGFRGKKVQLPADARATVVSRVRAAWRKLHPDAKDEDMPSGIQKCEGENTMPMTLDQIEKRVTEQDGVIATLTAENSVLKAQSEEVLKMSKGERKAFATMDADKRKAYMAADTEKRKAMMKDAQDALMQKAAEDSMDETCKRKYASAGPKVKAQMLKDQMEKLAKAGKKKGDPEPDGDENDDENDDEDDVQTSKRIAKVERDTVHKLAVMEDRVMKTEEELATVTKARRLDYFVHKAESELPNTPGTPVEKGQNLMELADALPSGEDGAAFKKHFANMKSADNILRSTHFAELGKSSGVEVPAAKALDGLAQEIAKRDKCNIGKAWEKACMENPEVYHQYDREQRQLTRTA